MSANNPAVVIGVEAVNNAKAVLDQVDNQVKSTTDKLVAEGERTNSKWSQVAQNFKANALNISMSVAGLGAGIVGFATSFDTIEKAQTRAEQANLSYNKAVERLADLQKSGKASANDIAIATEQVRLSQEKAAQATDSAKDAYTNFLANVPRQLLCFGSAAIGMFNLLKVTQATSAAVTVASAATYNGALASMNVATITTTGALHGFRIASIMAFLTNPVTAPILAIAAVVTLLAFNVGGLRDRVFELGKMFYEFLYTYFRPLADALKWFYDSIIKPLTGAFSTELPPAIDATTSALSQQTAVVVTHTQEMQKLTKSYADYYKAFNQSELAEFRLGGATTSDGIGIFEAGFDGSSLASATPAAETAAGFAASRQFSFSSPGVTHGTPASSNTARRSRRLREDALDAFLQDNTNSLDAFDRAAIMAHATDAQINIHLEVDSKAIAVATVGDLANLLVKKRIRTRQVTGRSTLA